MSDARTPPEIFYSYSHRDEALRKQLVTHLASLKRRGRISEWHDRMIEAGTNWEREISTHLESAQIILLLVSATFIESEYCFSIEMTRSMERHEAGEARVVPIILRDVVWTGLPFSALQALPSGGRPVESWGRRNSAFTDIVRGIDTVIDSLAAEETEEAPPERATSGPVTNVNGHHGYFTGRDTILGQVHAALAKGKGRERVQVLHGLSGVGKSRLAIAYMHRYGHEYRLAWRLRATEPTRIADDFAEMAGPLGLPVADPTDLPAIRDSVSRWLANHDNWLLVFDDASKPEDVIPYLPAEIRGHVLVTSLNAGWRQIGTPRRLPYLDRDASIRFLIERTGQADREGAGKVADLLGGLPLALAQAAAYIETRKTDFAGYARLFERRRKALWQQEEAPEDHDRRSVEVSFTLAISQVEKVQRAAVDLLRLCAFFAPDDIPPWLIRDGAEHLPKALRALVGDEMAWNEAVALLTRYSLIDVGQGGISVHNLVQIVVRDSLSETSQRRWAGTAVKLILATFPQESDDVRTWDRCAPLLPHALAAADHAEALRVKLEDVSHILGRSAGYLQGRAQLGDARAYFERALHINEVVHGPHHPNVAVALNNLGRLLHDLGNLAEARACLERSLLIDEATSGPSHPRFAIRLSNLGKVLHDDGDLAGAQANHERALAIMEAAFGPNHLYVATASSELGRVLRAKGDLVGARAQHERALRIHEAAYGSSHHELAAVINNLAGVLRDQGDLHGATKLFEHALRMDEATFGPDHPYVAIDLNNLGGVLQYQSDHAGARVHYARALRILEQAYGPDHPRTQIARGNLEWLEGGATPGG